MLKIDLPIKARSVPLFSSIALTAITSLVLASCSMNSPSDLRAQADEQIKSNNLVEAEKILKKAAADQEQSNGSRDIQLAPTLTALGNLYIRQGKYAEAATLFDRIPANSRNMREFFR